MAADVSYLSRILNGGGDTTDPGEHIATRDFLGDSNKELNLDLHVPSGFEKRLDLKSGKVYIEKCDSRNSSSEENKVNDAVSKLQDLDFPQSATARQSLNSNISDDETKLELKLFPSSSATPPASSSTTTGYSVCTIDKVKSALERMEKKSNNVKRRSVSVSMSSSPPSQQSSSSVKDGELLLLLREEEEEEEEEKSSPSRATTYAAGCRNCLLYVIVSRNDPKCPRCYVTVPPPTAFKKPRIDLNISL